MLDLDLNNFKYSRQKLDKALKKILLSLKKDDIIPIVIWTGNGYHVLVPLQPLQLLNYRQKNAEALSVICSAKVNNDCHSFCTSPTQEQEG